MPKSKGKVPRITFRAVQPITLGDEVWQTVEAVYRQKVPEEVRAKITAVTNQFLRLASAENTGSMDDAIRRAQGLRKCTQLLIDAIEARAVGDVTREYVDDELALSYARLNSDQLCKIIGIRAAPLAARKYIDEVYVDLLRFLSACKITLKELDRASQNHYWPDGGAWEVWIWELTGILEKHNLPTGVRKDTDKINSDRASPFVEFVGRLQTFIPEKHIRAQHSKGALATAINKARNELKPFVARKKARGRKTGRNLDNRSP